MYLLSGRMKYGALTIGDTIMNINKRSFSILAGVVISTALLAACASDMDKKDSMSGHDSMDSKMTDSKMMDDKMMDDKMMDSKK